MTRFNFLPKKGWITAKPPTNVPDQCHSRYINDEKELFPMIQFDMYHRRYNALSYAIFILFCNLAAPCILFYVLLEHTSLSLQDIVGISSGLLGVSSSFDAPFRTYKLWKYRSYYGPLGDSNRWHLDFTNHVYTLALFIFAIPLAVASAFNPPLTHFFLMTMPLLFGPIGLVMLVSLFAPKLPIWASSDPPGTRMKPAMFYFVEDLGAVDCRHGAEFRKAMHNRYNASPPFQKLFRDITIFWTLGTAVHFGVVVAIAWTVSFRIGFGLVLGITFAWVASWFALSIPIVQYGRKREMEWWIEKIKREEPGNIKRIQTLELRRDSMNVSRPRVSLQLSRPSIQQPRPSLQLPA